MPDQRVPHWQRVTISYNDFTPSVGTPEEVNLLVLPTGWLMQEMEIVVTVPFVASDSSTLHAGVGVDGGFNNVTTPSPVVTDGIQGGSLHYIFLADKIFTFGIQNDSGDGPELTSGEIDFYFLISKVI